MPVCGAYHELLALWSIRICWLGLFAVWIVGGVYNRLRSPKVERRQFTTWRWIIPIAAWIIFTHMPRQTWSSMVVCQDWLRGLGLVLLYVGTAFALWARVALGTMWTGEPAQRAHHELHTTGPYAITRHPIYTGLLTMLLGSTLMYHIGVMGPFFVIILITFIVKLKIEERLMLELFGTSYEEYRQRVPALFPWPR